MDRDDELLFYVQNRLSRQDRQAFDARLAADQDLAAELAVLQAARSDFAEETKMAPDLSAGWADLETRMDAVTTPVANENQPIRLNLLQVAAVAALAVMAWHFIAVPKFTKGLGGFETASQEVDAHVMQVIFRADATFEEAASFLTLFSGTMSDGPSAVGVYRVRFANLVQLEDALEAAKANSSLFEFAAIE